MSDSPEPNPILNNPYQEPERHYRTHSDGTLDYDHIEQGRRLFVPMNAPMPAKNRSGQGQIFGVNESQGQYEQHLINYLRREISRWREAQYPGVTKVSRELLAFWFLNDSRTAIRNLFFAQREAIETAIWLNEVAETSNPGGFALNQLRNARKLLDVTNGSNSPLEAHEQLPRTAFKMATGTGKTVVMAALIVYHYFNRSENLQDTRFADYFLIITPGITIRDRLMVLKVDGQAPKNQRKDYYAVRDLVPHAFEHLLPGLNQRLKIINYHQLQRRALEGNKRTPTAGKVVAHTEDGKPIKDKNLEDYKHMVARVLNGFREKSRLLILNDEAHHCYKPLSKGKTRDTENDENARAAMWFTGLAEINRRFKVQNIYDLSATPYYLKGSG